MTQPAPQPVTSQQPVTAAPQPQAGLAPAVAPQGPVPPMVTHIVEHTQQVLRVVDQNGHQTVTTESRVNTWQINKPIPGDESTVVVAMFRSEDGGARVWVRPADGTPGAAAGMAFLIELPAATIRFTMKTLPAAQLAAEVSADMQDYIDSMTPEPDPEPEPEPAQA